MSYYHLYKSWKDKYLKYSLKIRKRHIHLTTIEIIYVVVIVSLIKQNVSTDQK